MRIDNDLTPKVIQCDIKGANGLAFSPDGKWMLTSDTPQQVIYRTPLDADGEPGQREVLRRFADGEGMPDGAAVDVEGATGVRSMMAGVSHVFHPKGSSWRSIVCRYAVRRWSVLVARP